MIGNDERILQSGVSSIRHYAYDALRGGNTLQPLSSKGRKEPLGYT